MISFRLEAGRQNFDLDLALRPVALIFDSTIRTHGLTSLVWVGAIRHLGTRRQLSTECALCV